LQEQIRLYFGNGSRFGATLVYPETTGRLNGRATSSYGTAGTVKLYQDFLAEQFFVIYGDQLTDLDLKQMRAFHNVQGGIGTIFLQEETIMDATSTPSCVVRDGPRIREIIEWPTPKDHVRLRAMPPEDVTMKTGVYLFERRALSYIPDRECDFSKDVLPEMLKHERLNGFELPSYMRDIGQIDRYTLAQEDVRAGRVRLY
jgi:NDP-sugar pyrophosphorylase family protein